MREETFWRPSWVYRVQAYIDAVNFFEFSQTFGNSIVQLKFIYCVFRTYFILILLWEHLLRFVVVLRESLWDTRKLTFCYSFSHVARRILQRVQEVLQVSEKLPEHCCTTESLLCFIFFFFLFRVFFSALYFFCFILNFVFLVLRILSPCSFKKKIPCSIPTLTLIDLMREGEGNFKLVNYFWVSGLKEEVRNCRTYYLSLTRSTSWFLCVFFFFFFAVLDCLELF